MESWFRHRRHKTEDNKKTKTKTTSLKQILPILVLLTIILKKPGCQTKYLLKQWRPTHNDMKRKGKYHFHWQYNMIWLPWKNCKVY